MNPRDSRFFPICSGCGGTCPIGKRKCLKCLKRPLKKLASGRAVRKGANAQGICAHKPSKLHGTKRGKSDPTFAIVASKLKIERWPA
jgi:hypothetical protein